MSHLLLMLVIGELSFNVYIYVKEMTTHAMAASPFFFSIILFKYQTCFNHILKMGKRERERESLMISDLNQYTHLFFFAFENNKPFMLCSRTMTWPSAILIVSAFLLSLSVYLYLYIYMFVLYMRIRNITTPSPVRLHILTAAAAASHHQQRFTVSVDEMHSLSKEMRFQGHF